MKKTIQKSWHNEAEVDDVRLMIFAQNRQTEEKNKLFKVIW